jgi:hypothetical protein
MLFEIADQTKSCCASALISILIFSGTAYAQTCNEDNTTWGFIKDIAEKSTKLIDGLDSVGSQDQVLEALGLVSEGADKQDIDCLRQQISLGFRDNRWAQAEEIIGQAQNLAWLAINNMKERDRRGEKITPTETESTDAELAAHALFTDQGSVVFYQPFDQDAQSQGMRYLSYTKGDLVKNGPNSFYDWRLGIPAALQLISYRILVMAALHPNFVNDGWYDTELEEYRKGLIKHYENMLKGVRCVQPIPPGSNISYTRYSCADIHTGLSANAPRSKMTCNKYYTYNSFWGGASIALQDLCGASAENDEEVITDVRREVIRSMPLYELKAMIDTLYLYTHRWLDLTKEDQRLPSRATPSLCLEAIGAQAYLSVCDRDPTEHWVYDRRTGIIINPDIGKCLEISFGIHASGQSFPVGVADCFGDEWQRWTYDPETGVLLSAMGPVLTINSAQAQSGDVLGSPLAEKNDVLFPGQQWLAVQPVPHRARVAAPPQG